MPRTPDDVTPAKEESTANPWLVEQFRLTAFPVSSVSITVARAWWAAAMGQDPENVQEEPRKGSIQLRTSHGGGQLVMNATAQRFDIRQLFAPSPDAPPSSPEYSTCRGPFVELASGWLGLPKRPQIQRLAFGVVATNTRSSSPEGCRQILAQYLPAMDMARVELRDFLFQGNRRRSSDVIEGVEINRVVKWSISTVQDILITPTGTGMARHPFFSPRLEVDINSSPRSALRDNRLVQLFQEFAKLADPIVTSGDRS